MSALTVSPFKRKALAPWLAAPETFDRILVWRLDRIVRKASDLTELLDWIQKHDKTRSTPWSGQRATWRHLWPEEMPDHFTVDLDILMHWNRKALRLRSIVADDWTNPQKPKGDLMSQELDVIIHHGFIDGRLDEAESSALRKWYDRAHSLMAEYKPTIDKPQDFEQELLRASMQELRRRLDSIQR